MIRSLIVVLIALSLGCSADQHSFPPVPLILDSLTDLGGVPKIRRIFRKGVTYVYSAHYYDQNNQIITSEIVKIIGTGERWEVQPEAQDVVKLVFETSEEDRIKIESNPINKTANHGWTTNTTEGIIENNNTVWIHPIRHNQYLFTEVAAFPEIKLPAVVGKTWSSNISGLGGWGDWDDMTINSSYEITDRVNIMLMAGELQCWEIFARSTFELGESKALFYFNEDYGFVRMEYVNYENQKLIFELEKVEVSD